MTGCSIRTAQVNTAELRKGMVEKRDRIIWQLHQAGRDGKSISAELEIDPATVSNVITELKKRDAEETQSERPAVDWGEEPEADDTPPPDDTKPPRHRVDMRNYLPALEKRRPVAEDEAESGAVGTSQRVREVMAA